MKKLILLFPLLFGCTSTGDPDWPAIGVSVGIAGDDARVVAELPLAADVRDELLLVADALELVAPHIVAGEGGLEAVEALDTAEDICKTLLERGDLSDDVRGVLVIVRLAINHARPYFTED